jgi:hypothetical protein
MAETNHDVKIGVEVEDKGASNYFRDLFKKISGQQKQADKSQKESGKAQQNTKKSSKQELDDAKKLNAELKKRLDILKKINAEEERKRKGEGGGGGSRRERLHNQRNTFFGSLGHTISPFGNDRRNWRGRMGNMIGSGINRFGSLATAGIAGLALAPLLAVKGNYDKSNAYNISLARLSGLNSGGPFGSGVSTGGMDSLRRSAGAMGYMPEEAINATREFSRATGDSRDALRGLTYARTTGLDTSEIASMFTAQRRGAGAFNEGGNREFLRMMSAAFQKGIDASTLPEFMEGVSGFIDRTGAVSGGKVSGEGYAGMLALLHGSGLAGLQGNRGNAVLGNIDAAIKGGGGSDEGRAFMLNTLGFGRTGGVGYYEAEKQRQLGLGGERGPALAADMLQNAMRMTGGNKDEAIMSLSRMTGNSISQWEALEEALAGGSGDDVSKAIEDMTATELTHLTSIDDNIRTLVGKAARSASHENEAITAGNGSAESLERIEDLFRDYMKTMAATINTHLPAIAGWTEALVESAKTLAEYITHPGDTISGVMDSTGTTSSGARSFVADTARAEALANDGGPLDIESIGLRLGANERLRNTMADSPWLASEEAFVTGLNSSLGASPGDMLYSELPTDRINSMIAENIATAAAALDRVAERQGRGAEVDPRNIRTEAQLLAAIASLGIEMPAASRNIVDPATGSP